MRPSLDALLESVLSLPREDICALVYHTLDRLPYSVLFEIFNSVQRGRDSFETDDVAALQRRLDHSGSTASRQYLEFLKDEVIIKRENCWSATSPKINISSNISK